MWFKRKPKNRRLEREHVLDVKLRSGKLRAARLRLAAVSFGVVFGTMFGLYLLWRTGEWALNHFVYENKSFSIQEIQVQTDGVIAVDQLRRWSGVKPGQNLLALDLARVKRDLELAPIVQSASVERVLPHTLSIRIIEREPVAQVNLPRHRPDGGIESAVFQLDAEGYVLVPLDTRQRNAPASPGGEQLPLISGVKPSEVQPGRQVEARQVQAALQLIVEFEQSPMAGLVDLKQIDVTQQEVLLVTTGQGSEITFGLQNIEQQLWRWREIFDRGQRMSKVVASLDLAITNNIPARWLEANAVPPTTPKAPKQLRSTRKKHV
jgi:cell division protein FtsQ